MKVPDLDNFFGTVPLPQPVSPVLFDDAGDGVLQVDPQGTTTYANAALAALLGYESAAELVGIRVDRFVHPEEAEAHCHQVTQRTAGLSGQYERRFCKRDGSIVRCRVDALPLIGKDGRYAGSSAIVRPADGGEAERARLAMRVFTHAREAIMVAAVDGTILEVNDAFLRITGYQRHEVVGQNPRIFQSGRHGKDFYTAFWHQIRNQGYWEGEVWNRRKNGEIYPQHLSVSAARDTSGKTVNYVSLFSDITEQKAHVEQLEHVVHYDALTGLPNRMLLSDRLTQALARARRHGTRVAVASFDLDGFKQINDRYGYAVGDRLLVTLAGRFQHVVRESDTVARIGGDGFIVVFKDLPEGVDYRNQVIRILSTLGEPVQLGTHAYRVTACAGISVFPQAEEVDAEQLLRQAHQAMFQAKLEGRNRYSEFDEEFGRSVRGRNELLEQVHQGLRNNELVLHYQPVVNLSSGEVPFVEALLRWQHPERGVLAPGQFLPQVEDHPLIVEIGYRTLELALTQISAWHAEGVEIGVSVNVGARQLQQPDFVQQLQSRLRAYPDVRPGQLKLEVLESSALDDISHVTKVIAACNEIGVPFALDDFGTGYSSLLYLKRLPAQQIKIDQSFVRDMLDDPEDLAILEGIIGLAAAFRRDTVAEGVETLEHAELLLRLGCAHAQGYGIARPMPGHDLPGWLRKWQAPSHWKQSAPLQRDCMPLLYARVEHKAWMRTLESWFADRSQTPPELDHKRYLFHLWLRDEGQRHYGKHPLYGALVSTHESLYALATEVVTRPGEVLPARLRALHMELLHLLEQLADSTAAAARD